MRFLHFFGLGVHGLIASTHAHECWVAGHADLHKLIVTVAYVALAVLQAVALYLTLRKCKGDAPPVG